MKRSWATLAMIVDLLCSVSCATIIHKNDTSQETRQIKTLNSLLHKGYVTEEASIFFADTINIITINDGNRLNKTSEKPYTGKEKKKIFELFLFELSWMEAFKFCKSKGGDLAAVLSKEENALVLEQLYNSTTDLTHVWSGGVCPFDGNTCFWTDTWSKFSYRNFKAGEPNHQGEGDNWEMCVELKNYDKKEWRWNDGSCYTPYPFLCHFWTYL